ncbi:RICIN domain-containing protein [Streptomyces mirabilis]|uniref:RICIN domain-containing protein n=1 Tax=Streptomyces mirabilis TaxID=68239 RepID=UPI00332F3D54
MSLGVATLASLLCGLPSQSARADPAGTPTYRALAGGGSATTQYLMNAMADAVKVNGQKVLASYDAPREGLSSTITTKDPATNQYCTVNRPAHDAAALGALGYSVATADGCLDFARLGGEPTTQQSIPPANGLTYLPYAVDGLTYAVDRYSPLYAPTLADLKAIYTCASTQYHPLLPASGSQQRSEWLAALGIPEADVLNGKYPCIKESYSSMHTPVQENDEGALLYDNLAVTPFSTAALTTGRGEIRTGEIASAPDTDGRGPLVPNSTVFPDGVSYTYVPEYLRDLTLAELTGLYHCTTTQIDGKSIIPLLPVASATRTSWLHFMGITEADLSAGRYPCISTTTPSGDPIQPDDGNMQPWANTVMPYSIAGYIAQTKQYDNGAVVQDKHKNLKLGGLAQDAGVVQRPIVLNPNYGRTLVHRLYNAIPSEKQRISPWRDVFVGPNSLICQNTGLIETYGFTRLASDFCGGGDRPVTDPAPPTFRFRDGKSNKCLTIHNASTGNGGVAVQMSCTTGLEQQWTWTGTNGRELKNANSGLCLEGSPYQSPLGAAVVQTSCESGTELPWMQWILEPDPAGAGNRLRNVYSSMVLSVSGGGSLANDADLIMWSASNGPEQDWTPESVVAFNPGSDTLMDTSTTTSTTSPLVADLGQQTVSATAATSTTPYYETVQVNHPKRLVDVRNGRCRFQGDWEQGSAYRNSGVVGGAFLYATGYLTGPKCAVTMQMHVVSYDFREETVLATDHYYDASKPTSAGKNERWMQFGPIIGGVYYPKIGNVVYRLDWSLKDLTASNPMPSWGIIWGPTPNWCDWWVPPTSPPGCNG